MNTSELSGRRRIGRITPILAAVLCFVTLAGCTEQPGRATHTAQIGTSGPVLETPVATLSKAMVCAPPAPGTKEAEPVVLVTGFETDPREDFEWSYWYLLPKLGHLTCMIDFPSDEQVDEQVSAEYVVYTIRTLYARTGQKVTTISHSMGGVLPVWALRFWPDLASKVDDVISMGTPYQGTTLNRALCLARPACQPALWQVSVGSNFLRALNARPLPAGPSYTAIYGEEDELVQPAGKATYLAGAANIGLATVCPGRVVEHHMLAADAAVYAIVMDAMNHPGPAVPSRVSKSVCARTGMPGFTIPGMNMADFEQNYFKYLLAPYTRLGSGPMVESEPPLRPYAR